MKMKHQTFFLIFLCPFLLFSQERASVILPYQDYPVLLKQEKPKYNWRKAIAPAALSFVPGVDGVLNTPRRVIRIVLPANTPEASVVDLVPVPNKVVSVVVLVTVWLAVCTKEAPPYFGSTYHHINLSFIITKLSV